MLKFLRKKGVAKKILWVIAIVIIISFGIFGTANYLTNSAPVGHAGKIFSKAVSFDEFATSLTHTRAQAIMNYGDNYQKISQFLNLESEAWDRIILIHEAQKRKIRISDDDVVNTVEKLGYFQENGQFQSRLYERIVRYVFQCTPRDFEESVRESMMFTKLFEQETASVTLPEEEVRNEYKKKNEKVKVDYVVLNPEDYTTEVTFNDMEAMAYYEEHKGNFFVPPMINLQYLHLPFPEENERGDFPEVTAQADKIAEDIKNNLNLNEIAQNHSLKIEESGFFSFEQPNMNIGWSFDLLSKALELKINQITEPIKTSKGYYVLKLINKKESSIPDFKDIRPKVEEAFKLSKAQEVTQKKAEDFLNKIKDSMTNNPANDFRTIAESFGLKVEETQAFSHGEYLSAIGVAEEFQNAAFALDNQIKMSKVVKIAKGYAFMYLKEFTPINEEQFNKEKDEFAKNLLTKKKGEAFSTFIKDLRTKADLVDNISKVREANQPR